MGKLGGSARSVTSSIGSCLHHCQQGNVLFIVTEGPTSKLLTFSAPDNEMKV